MVGRGHGVDVGGRTVPRFRPPEAVKVVDVVDVATGERVEKVVLTLTPVVVEVFATVAAAAVRIRRRRRRR